jgi:hypothetical protein
MIRLCKRVATWRPRRRPRPLGRHAHRAVRTRVHAEPLPVTALRVRQHPRHCTIRGEDIALVRPYVLVAEKRRREVTSPR